MRKKIIKITFFLLMVVLNFFPVGIWAKEISKTCKYNNTKDDGTVSLAGYSYLEIYIYNDKTLDSKIFEFAGEDIWDNEEPVLNLEKADECPSYAVIGWIDNLGPINEYEVYASDDVEYLREKSFDKKTVVNLEKYNNGNNSNGNNSNNNKYKNFYDEKDKSYYKCGNLTRIPKGVPKFTNLLYRLIKVIVPIILVVMGTSDFLRAVSANDEKSMDETPKRFARRIGAAVLIYFVMTMVQLVIKVIDTDNKSSVLSCAKCFVSSEKKCETYNYSFGQANEGTGSEAKSSKEGGGSNAGGKIEGGGFR